VFQAESIAVIESGGVVDCSPTPAMQLVKRGGALMDFGNPNGIVFYEQGAILGSMLMNPRRPHTERFMRVPRITASPGVGPFIYQAAPRPDPGAIPAVPPLIRSVFPLAAAAGDVITLQGEGFSRSTHVLFLGRDRSPTQAGFRIISDQQLRVEVPDLEEITGPQAVAVMTTEGLTVTIPRDRTIRPGPTAPVSRRRMILSNLILWVGAGDEVQTGGCPLIFVSQDGMVLTGQILFTGFIQSGGGLGDDGGRARAVYYEPGAIVPERIKKGPAGHEVRAVVPSFLAASFVVLPGPLFRR
jgi:hypothetical protein